MKTGVLAISIGVGLLSAMIFGSVVSAKETADNTVSEVNSKVVEKLGMIVKLQERRLREHRVRIAAGVVGYDDSVEPDLLAARLDLARELQQTDKVRELLQQAVKLHQTRLQIAESRQAVERRPEIQRIRIDLLRAEIDLIRAGG